MSGGTFLGVPSLVYQFGWVLALWIASYMVAPLTYLGILGKRIGQLSRRTGAITLPDLFRERFGSPGLGLLTSFLVMFFLTANLVAQFKAGALILQIVLPKGVSLGFATGAIDPAYYVGLAIFTATVVAYTAYGGFLAAIWTDVFQSIVMAIGVLILLPLALYAAGGLGGATSAGIAQAGPRFAFGPGGVGRDFHPLGMAVSFFVMWAITGMGQPSTLVRLMAFRDSRTLRYSILYLTAYNAVIYIPIILIFVAARSILPDLGGHSDEVMPRLVIHLANPYVAGLILAAPYGAVMSTVSGFLLIVASGPRPRRVSALPAARRPGARDRARELPRHGRRRGGGGPRGVEPAEVPATHHHLLQHRHGRRVPDPRLARGLLEAGDRPGAIAAMVVGTGRTIGLYGLGWEIGGDPKIGVADASFRPFYLLGCDPCIWADLASLLAGPGRQPPDRPPEPARVALLFDATEKSRAISLWRSRPWSR